MGDVLSQNEIDSLLQALSTGELEASDLQQENELNIKNYDFARPSKFSKEHLRTLGIIFEQYARLLSTSLPLYLRKNVQITVVNAEAITYSEFSNSLSNPVLLGIVDFAPLDGNIIIELADNIGFAMIDLMLGGSGKVLDKIRDFSEIEVHIMERIMSLFVVSLEEPWQSVMEINPSLERIETNSQYAQIISPNEMISIVTMNIAIGEVEGLMNVCIPYSCIESIIDKINTKYWYSTTKEEDKDEYFDFIQNSIEKAMVPVKAVLGRSSISLNDFVNIQKGDIIRLDKKINDELEVYVGNVKKFNALPGASQNSYAIRVTSVLREE